MRHFVLMAAHLVEGDAVGAFGVGGELADVVGGKKILGHYLEQPDGRDQAPAEHGENEEAMAEAPAQRALVHTLDRVETLLAPLIEAPMMLGMTDRHGTDEPAAQHGRQSDRDDSRHDDRDHHGDREFVQKASDDTAHEKNRNEHRAERDRHRQDGEGDFARAFERGFIRILAGLHMAHDVFQHHDGVVDHEADAQRQRHQRKIVEAVAESSHAGEGADDGNGKRNRWNEGRRSRAQEQEDHCHNENRRDQKRDLHVVHRRADGFAAVEGDLKGDRAGDLGPQLGQHRLDRIDNRNGVGAGLPVDADGNAGLGHYRCPTGMDFPPRR